MNGTPADSEILQNRNAGEVARGERRSLLYISLVNFAKGFRQFMFC